jgi:hypothetical protein
MITRRPRCANARAAAAPIPSLAPVMMIVSGSAAIAHALANSAQRHAVYRVAKIAAIGANQILPSLTITQKQARRINGRG